MLANWVRARTGRDPAAHLRGRYHTRLGWLRIANRAGGLTALVDDLARQAGLERMDQPRLGAVGIVAGPDGPTGAIFTGRRWVTKAPRSGLTAGPAVALAIWG